MERVVVWFKFKSEGFSKKILREDQDGGLIHWKLKGLFANLPEPWRLDCRLLWVFFQKKRLREEAGLWVDFVKYRGLFFLQNDQDSPDLDRPCARSDGRERLAMWPRCPPAVSPCGFDIRRLLFPVWDRDRGPILHCKLYGDGNRDFFSPWGWRWGAIPQ
jgi:hypothetical protein